MNDENMQVMIVRILEKLGPSYAEDGRFVPQSVIWERLTNPETKLVWNSSNITERCFLSALSGKKNSLALFESTVDDEISEVKWRLRPKSHESEAARLEKKRLSQIEQAKQIEGLQKTVRELRAQVAAIEAENVKCSLAVERLKQAQNPEVQKAFDLYETLYQFLDRQGSSLENVEKEIAAIGAKIPKI